MTTFNIQCKTNFVIAKNLILYDSGERKKEEEEYENYLNLIASSSSNSNRLTLFELEVV